MKPLKNALAAVAAMSLAVPATAGAVRAGDSVVTEAAPVKVSSRTAGRQPQGKASVRRDSRPAEQTSELFGLSFLPLLIGAAAVVTVVALASDSGG